MKATSPGGFFVSFDFMKRKIILGIGVMALMVSCSKKDEQFCKCLEAGEKLNEFSNSILEKGATKEDEVKIKQLRAEKDSACVNYITMGGDEMRAKKKDCGYE